MSMEVSRTKRRKLDRVGPAAQDSPAGLCDVDVDQAMDPLPESTALVTHRRDMCFGMIKIELKSLRAVALGADGDNFVEVSLNLEGDHLIARNIATQAHGGLFGRQNRSTTVLRELYEHHKATIRAWLIRTDGSTRKNPVYELFVVVYGMHTQKDAISDTLDCAELFFQDPPDQVRGDQSLRYFNPHRLYNPVLGSGMRPPVPVKIMKQHRTLCDTNPLKRRVQEVMDSACGPRHFAVSQQSPRIRTILKQHQMKAIAMMFEKENNGLDQNVFGSLWKVLKQHDSIRYQNTVTGAVQTDFPHVCHGGILADDMGLGKTLTAISLIARSEDRTEFRSDQSSLSRTTLIVTPLSLLQTWEEQILNHVHRGQLSHYKYYGASKGDVSSLTNYDIVLTTYDTVSTEPRGTVGYGLGSMEWLRVILDEAHVIRNRSTKRFRAVCGLKAYFRWCLTGTPIYNRVEDLGSLMEFLGAHPLDSSSTFNSRIANPVAKGTTNGLEALRKLVHATALRRNKDSIRDELRLTGRRIIEETVQLNENEQRDYDLLKSRYASIIHEDDGTSISRRSIASIMQTIARLRQFCDHGLDLLPKKVHQLFDHSRAKENRSWGLVDALELCAVCQIPVNEDSQSQDSLDCGHYLCSQCQGKASEQETMLDIVCKLCDRDVAKSSSNSSSPKTPCNAATSDYIPSSKVQALLRNLMSERQSASNYPIKSVVFSCWTKMLDLIQRALVIQGLEFVRIDGSKTETARREAISRFRGDHTCRILLATFGSAGVGLDLTVASRVHIIEPQRTQNAENQAIDRVHRLGQTEDVIATRYVVKNSIEEYASCKFKTGSPPLCVRHLRPTVWQT